MAVIGALPVTEPHEALGSPPRQRYYHLTRASLTSCF